MNRRAHQCHRDGCDSEANHEVRLHINCVAPGVVEPVHMNSTIKVCDRHKDDKLVRDYLLSPRNRDVIMTSLMEGGHHEPDFLTARIEFVPLPRKPLVIEMPKGVICDRDGCGKPARFQIKQLFRMMWQRGKGKPLVEALTNLCVCEDHRRETTVADVMDGEGRSATLAFLASRGVAMPDFDTAEIAFEPLLDGKRLDPFVFVGEGQPRDAVVQR